MKMKLQTAKGVQDVPPEEKIVKNKVVSALQETFEAYGFAPLETPLLERYETLASKFAANDFVRTILREMQRRLVKNKDYIAEGRDMGTYVFPDAKYKFYLDADLKIRAKRRASQLKEMLGINMNEERVSREIKDRDKLDMTRESCPLHPADDAVIIDTSDMTINEVVLKIESVINDA